MLCLKCAWCVPAGQEICLVGSEAFVRELFVHDTVNISKSLPTPFFIAGSFFFFFVPYGITVSSPRTSKSPSLTHLNRPGFVATGLLLLFLCEIGGGSQLHETGIEIRPEFGPRPGPRRSPLPSRGRGRRRPWRCCWRRLFVGGRVSVSAGRGERFLCCDQIRRQKRRGII